MFYLTTHSTHFIYSYMASDIWLRTIQIEREETRCRLIGYSFRLTARVLLYTSSHRQDDTYHRLCYASRGALAGTRNKLLTHLNVEFLESRILLLVDLRERRIERHRERSADVTAGKHTLGEVDVIGACCAPLDAHCRMFRLHVHRVLGVRLNRIQHRVSNFLKYSQEMFHYFF